MTGALVQSYILASIGSCLMVLAYGLNLFGLCPSNSLMYSSFNAIGGALNVAASALTRTWPFVVLYGLWTAVGVYGLLKLFHDKMVLELYGQPFSLVGDHSLFGWEMLSLSSPDHLGFQGWRWHSLSILYELACLKNSSYFYANKCYNCFRRCSSSDSICFQQCKKTCHRDSQIVHKALHHIWDWNWKTFVLVEEKLFFPWLRSLQVKSAYEGILSELEKERQRVVDVSSNKQQQSHSSPQHSFFSRWQDKFANIVFQPWFLWKDRSKQRESSSTASVATCKTWKADTEQQYQELFKTYRLVTLLHDLCDQYFDHERKWLLPKISALVPVREQKKFNNRVLRFLGYATCRLQLVVLDESLKCRHPEEWRQFRSQVPKPVRLLIPYWKRRHYKQMHRHMCILGP